MNLLLILKTNFMMRKTLKNSWNKAHMPHELIYFYNHLFNIPQPYLCIYQVIAYDIEDDDDGADLRKRKLMKIALLPLFIGHSVYKKCKSREVLTLVKLGYL